MSLIFPILGSAGRWERPAGLGPRSAAGASFTDSTEAAGGAGQPPPEVRAEVRAAARCADQLHKLGRQLHFELDSESGRIRIEVRDLDGNVLRKVPPSEVFDFAAGKATS